jgi:hypothetical protein
MQEQQRRTFAAEAREDAARRGVDSFGLVARKQISQFGHLQLPIINNIEIPDRRFQRRPE